jgi:hypothetical protein
MADTLILFRVEPHEYNGTTTLQVTWIDKADASPTKTLPKYDTAKLQGLTAKFSGVLSAAAPTPVAAKPPTGKPAVPPKAKGKAAARPTVPAAASPAPANPPAAPSTATPPPASPATVPPAPSTPPVPSAEVVTKDLAWQAVAANPILDVPQDKLAEIWIAEGSKVGKAEDAFTSADWATVRDAVLQQTSKF